MSRDAVLTRVRKALGRTAGPPSTPIPPPKFYVRKTGAETTVRRFREALEKLNATVHEAHSAQDVHTFIRGIVDSRPFVMTNSAVLKDCNIDSLPSLSSDIPAAAVGVTGATYALANTGTLVVMAGAEENRLMSLLPPVHVAVVRESQILSGIDELFERVPNPAELTSAMILITGPSRTADIEQILVRGVHGPGELHVVLWR